jgi:hypothetical protein
VFASIKENQQTPQKCQDLYILPQVGSHLLQCDGECYRGADGDRDKLDLAVPVNIPQGLVTQSRREVGPLTRSAIRQDPANVPTESPAFINCALPKIPSAIYLAASGFFWATFREYPRWLARKPFRGCRSRESVDRLNRTGYKVTSC